MHWCEFLASGVRARFRLEAARVTCPAPLAASCHGEDRGRGQSRPTLWRSRLVPEAGAREKRRNECTPRADGKKNRQMRRPFRQLHQSAGLPDARRIEAIFRREEAMRTGTLSWRLLARQNRTGRGAWRRPRRHLPPMGKGTGIDPSRMTKSSDGRDGS